MKKFLIILLILLLAAAAGLGYFYYRGIQKYTGIFLPNTTINGINAEGKTPEFMENELTKDYYVGEITVNEKDGKAETIAISDVIDSVDLAVPVSSFLNEEDVKYWPLRIREVRTFEDEVSVTFDDEKLKDLVHELSCISGKDIKAPEDAYFAKTAKGFEVVPETEGTLLDEDKVYEAVKECLYDGTLETDLVEKDCYVKAKITSDDPSFKPILTELDKYKNLSITMNMVEAEEVLDYKVLEPMLSYEGGKFKLDDKALAQYVNGLEKKYHTYQTERLFKTHSGQTIAVGGNGGETYGFWLNEENTTERLKKAIESLQSQAVEPSWVTNAMTRGQENGDIGGTYIEVSIDEQHMWFYRGYEQVFETAVVTGKESDEHRRTPRGVFCLLNKKTDHTMSGNYGTQFCHYFMVFDWTGCAIHDAYWRDEFGGDVYLYDGSHGCVNTPPDAMRELFDMVYTGLPVIIY